MRRMKELHLVAANIRSAYNVGALLRTADSLGVTKIWMAGYTPPGDHPAVQKTALGAEKTVAWEHVPDVIGCLERLKQQGVRVVALELTKDAADLRAYAPSFPMALVLGNEVEGLSALQLNACDETVMIPQKGSKESLNVMVAAGIAAWVLLGS
jgi:tRNA G18 (ribose-2'-O)-methylase SpoU